MDYRAPDDDDGNDDESKPRAPGDRGRRARLLIVDDDVQLLRGLARALGEYEVLTADGGRAALALLERDPAVDAILCDLEMREGSGMELYAEIARRWPTLAKQVVFMTGGAYTAATQDFLASIANVCLQKPFDLAALRAVLLRRG